MSEYKKYLEEKALHKFFKKMDINLAKGIYNDLLDANVIDRDVKFGEVLNSANINGYRSHSNDFSHNYREEIESYNQIITRDKKYIS